MRLLGGAATTWPLGARAQQGEPLRRIGVLMSTAADDPEGQARIAAFQQGLQQFNWTIGRNVRIDSRWPAGDSERFHSYAAELVALSPDVILATGSAAAEPLLRATRTIPVVFVVVPDPVEQIAPGVTRAAVLRDPAISAGIGQFGAIQAVAPSLGLAVTPVNVREADEIERAVADFARLPNGGLIVTGSALAIVRRHLIIKLAAKHQLPAVYFQRTLVADGGLISYGADLLDQYRRAASYVDRILKGEKPADLPVQMPTKYELVINLKTAKALGLEIPSSVLARADEVIE